MLCVPGRPSRRCFLPRHPAPHLPHSPQPNREQRQPLRVSEPSGVCGEPLEGAGHAVLHRGSGLRQPGPADAGMLSAGGLRSSCCAHSKLPCSPLLPPAPQAGKEYTHRRSGERRRRSHEKERRRSREQHEQPAPAAPAAQRHGHTRLGAAPLTPPHMPPAWQPPPVGLLAGSAAQRLAAAQPSLRHAEHAGEYDSSGVAAWLADSAAAALAAPGAAPVGPDADLQPTGLGRTPAAASEPQLSHAEPAALAAAPPPPRLIRAAIPAVPAAASVASAPGSARSATQGSGVASAACGASASGGMAGSHAQGPAPVCKAQRGAGDEAGCAVLKLVTSLARLLRF